MSQPIHQRLRVRTKLFLILFASVLVALGAVGLAVEVYDHFTFRPRMLHETRSLASLYALTLPPALEFNDPAAASENLSTLRTRPNVSAACVYKADWTIFAHYPAEKPPNCPPPDIDRTFVGEELWVAQPIPHDGEYIGYLVLGLRISPLYSRLPGAGIMIGGLLLALGIVSLLLIGGFGRFIARPLSDLASTADTISQTRKYSLRAIKRSGDEIGQLTDAFNLMLDSLEEAIRTRDDFLSIASHELRTPLTSLRLHIQLLAQLLQSPQYASMPKFSVFSKAVRQSEHQLERLARLVEDLLDVSRIGIGALRIQPERFDLGALTQDVADRHHGEFERYGCPLRLDLAPGLVGDWDPLRIEQVMLNLLTNAAKFAGGKPIDLTVKAGKARGTACLAVRDYGPGIPKADQQRIFERFERASPSERFAGLGLGLYISRQIVEAHGGSIHLASELGQGTTVWVELPLAPPSESI